MGDGIVLETFRSPADEPALVLLPGSFYDQTLWIETASFFPRRLDITVINLPGHGHSRPVLPDGSVEEYAALTLRAAEALGLRRFVIGGHSLGGMMAMEAARLAPGAVSGVAACEGWTHYSVLQTAFSNNLNDALPDRYKEKIRRMREAVTRDWTDDQYRGFSSVWKKWDGRRLLCETEIPVLSLWGDRGKDPPTPEQLGIPRRKNIRLEFIENAPHCLLWQHAKETAAHIGRFIYEDIVNC